MGKSKQKKNEQMNEGLALVLERNNFYNDLYSKVSICFWLLIVINGLLAFSIVYKVAHPVQPKYFAATADGHILLNQPLSEPLLSDNQVIQWAANSVRETFSQDFIHWRGQLQQASNLFTVYGWKFFLKTMKSSRNLDTLTNLKMVSQAQITSAPKIIRKGVLGNGLYAWNISMNINLVFRNASKTIQMPFQINLIVVRQPRKDYPMGVAINNFLPTPMGGRNNNSLI